MILPDSASQIAGFRGMYHGALKQIFNRAGEKVKAISVPTTQLCSEQCESSHRLRDMTLHVHTRMGSADLKHRLLSVNYSLLQQGLYTSSVLKVPLLIHDGLFSFQGRNSNW